MKKVLLTFMFGIISFLGINTVSADTYIPDFYRIFDDVVEHYITYKDEVNDLIDYWEENFSDEYPYYIIRDVNYNHYSLHYSKTNIITYYNGGFQFLDADNSIEWLYGSDEYIHRNDVYPLFDLTGNNNIVLSNGVVYNKLSSSIDTYLFPSYTSETLNITIPEFEVSTGDLFPTVVSLYDGSYKFESDSYTTINLNEYPYVALSLKDYTKTETFYTNMYVQGQLCLTPVYNYGMTEKVDIIDGSKNQRCSIYYDDFTIVRTYILEQDLKNNAIYYIKAYDTSKDNIIKVDTSVFDITYITEDTKDNPYVNVSGKTYPTISYDKLTDTATKSEDEDYISGVSCQVGDFNCYNQYNPSNIFSDLFDKPLEMLKSVWSAIVTIFNLIAEFILLLPPTMQGFLYIAFGISIILGIIKILL